MQVQTERAFASAATRLNSKNLPHLWAVSSTLSALEYSPRLFGDDRIWPLFPTLHPMMIALFDRAVLKGTSQQYREGRLTSSDLGFVLNSLNESSANPNYLTLDK